MNEQQSISPRRLQPDDIAPPLAVYADLMAATDPRNIETANPIVTDTLPKLSAQPDRPVDRRLLDILRRHDERAGSGVRSNRDAVQANL